MWQMKKVYNEITDYLNDNLKDEQREAVENGYTQGNYILVCRLPKGFDFCIRYPGATRGNIEVDEKYRITKININKLKFDYIYKIDEGKLEKEMTEVFSGMSLKPYLAD